MKTGVGEGLRRVRTYRAGTIMIGVTLTACLAALLFRTPLRSRYWAWQVVQAGSTEERAAPLTCLCNAGDDGRWGTEILLTHPDAEIRQFGVLVLQHARSDRSRRRLLQMLEDPGEAVREMAALGLAIHGDVSVIPRIRRLYTEGDASAASAACLALERLATPEAVAALAALATQPAEERRRAALVDTLDAIGTPDCAAALLHLLDDHRSCPVGPRAERLLARLAPLGARGGLAEWTTSRPTSERAAETVAERAAAALTRITGLTPAFASDLPDEQQAAAARVWRDWIAAHGAGP
jgi:HEAT repeat protein